MRESQDLSGLYQRGAPIMRRQTQSYQQDHMKIGRFQSSIENGRLKLYYHEFGSPSGMFCALNPEETRGLFELLARHSEDINHALSPQ
jgi:hypothetical protein